MGTHCNVSWLRRGSPPAVRFWLVAAAPLSLGPALALADEPPTVLEEIVVTSQRRAENLQEVPLAISAFRTEDLQKFGFSTPEALALQTPSLTIKGSQGETKPNVFLRGVGTNDFNATATSAVGFYTDQVYQGLPSGQLFQMFDLERVEVLRGPQGTLYGRNTTGGAVNFISNQPDGTTRGNLSATYGRFDQTEVEAAVQFPLGEKLSARLAGVYRSSSGDTENRFDGNDVNEYDTYALRAVARWEISDDNVWTFNVHTGQYNGEGPRYHFVRVDNGHYPDDVLPIIGVDAPYDEGDDWWAGSWDLPQDEDIESYGGSIVGVIETDSFTFTSVTGYENVDAFVRYDSDASPLSYVNVVYGDDGWMFSQELRLASNGEGPLSWIGGLYYYEDSVKADNSFDIARFARDLFGAPPDPNDPQAPGFYVQQWQQPTRSIAAFASLTYEFSDAWKATAGVRWTEDKKEFDFQTFQDEHETIGVIPLIDVSLDDSWSDVGGGASIQYTISPDAMLYASYNRGFKGGAYNGSPIFDPTTVRAVDPEYVNAYEVGAKTQFLEDRVQLNVAAFYNDYTDMQVFRFVPDPNTGIPTAFLENAASAEITGVEAEFRGRFGGLDLSLGAAYLDATYKDYVVQEGDSTFGNPTIDFSGNRLVGAPETHINAAVEYTFDLGGPRLAPRVEYLYSSRVDFDSSNNPLLAQGSYSVVNAALRLENIADQLDVTAWVRNLTEEEYATDALDLSNFGFDIKVHGSPRTYGVTLDWRFE